MGLGPGVAVVDQAGLQRVRDRMYMLEAAVKDVERDLRESSTPEDYQAAFRHLYAAAVDLARQHLEPVAIVGE